MCRDACPRLITYPSESIRVMGRLVILLTGSIIALALLSGCGLRSTGSTTRTTSSGTHARVVVHTSSARADANTLATATAECAAGEKLVSGGFTADIFESDTIVASYPSSANAWTVSGSSPVSWLTLTANAYCLANSGEVNVDISQIQTNGTLATANCPAGSVLTGGGYQGVMTRSSYPVGNGWAIEGSGTQTATVWALCATRGLTAAPHAANAFTLPAGFGVGGGGTATCGTDQMATGGGFRNDGIYALTANALTSDGTGWSVGAEANESNPSATPSGTVYAVCVTPAG